MKASQHPEAAFLAAMTGSATHEVRNVLAIIKESAGLVEDMLHVFAKKGTLDPEKIYRAVDRIDVQVKRGADLLTNLNRLSHTLDSEQALVELNHEVEQAVFLSQRFARKKGHRVVAQPSESETRVTVHPLHLHMAFFSAMECCMEALPDGAAITLSVDVRDGCPLVEFSGTTEDGSVVAGPPCGESWDCTQVWTDALGAKVHRPDSGFGIRILFPNAAGS
jgi:signal transduction histidine kinase